MKKLITILTVVAVFGLAGCGGGGSSRDSATGTGGGGTSTPPQTPAQAQEVAVDNPPTIPAAATGATAGSPEELAGEIVRQDSLSDRIAVLGNSVDTTTVAGSTTFTVEGTFEEAAPIAGFTPTVALTSPGLITGKGIFEDVTEGSMLADDDDPCARLTGDCTPLEISQALAAYDILPASIKASITKADFEARLATSPNLATLIFNLLPTDISDLEAVTVASIATLLEAPDSSAHNLLPQDARTLIPLLEFNRLLGMDYEDAKNEIVTVPILGDRPVGEFISEEAFDSFKLLNPLIAAADTNIDLMQLRGRSSGDFDASVVRWKYFDSDGDASTDEAADNYLTLGYWAYVPEDNDGEDGNNAEVGADVHGDDPFTPANVAGLTGTATYNGNAFGKAGDANFVADVTLMADFNANTIGGTIDEFNHDDTLTVTLGAAAITAGSNSFTGFAGGATPSATTGNWGGRFYGNGAAVTDHPLAVGGTFGVNDAGDAILGVFGAGLAP